jgi:hypothetical protein
MNPVFTVAYDTNPIHLCTAITLLQHLPHDTSSVHDILLHEMYCMCKLDVLVLFVPVSSLPDDGNLSPKHVGELMCMDDL